MSNPIHRRQARTAGLMLAGVLVLSPLLASSASAASPVALGAADSFALLAGSTITNSNSTTIAGDIGLCCTGEATTGFGPGANQVNQPSGATFVGTGTNAQTAQDALDSAYFDAAGRSPTFTVGNELTLTGTAANPLLPGVYESTSHGALEITGDLYLDFQGDPNAVFIFQGTSLTTGADSSVIVVNGGAGASSCNITWQLSDATQGVTLGTRSALKGTTLALGASTLTNGATVEGRILTRRSMAVTLDANTITRSPCSTVSGATPTPTSGTTPTAGTTPGSGTIAPNTRIAPPASRSTLPTRNGTAILRRDTPRSGDTPPAGGQSCTDGFGATVRGRQIKRVVFRLDGKRIASRHGSPFSVFVPARAGRHMLTARVTFKDATRAKTVKLGYSLCATVAARPRSGPPHFTG